MFTKKILVQFIMLITTALSLSSCSDNKASNLSDETVASSSTTNTCSAPTTKIIDYGARQTAGAGVNIRGAFSSVEINPAEDYAAVVYSETNATAGTGSMLKYMFWDGSNQQIETITSGLTTTFVKLVFLSSGKPLVFWGNGATALFMAVRSTASIDEVGTWTVSALDTSSTAIRAVDAAVNELDQVVVVFETATAASAKALICDGAPTTCDNASAYTTMTGQIDAGVGTLANSIGVAWCRLNSTTYYPAIAAGDTANSIFYMCRNGTLDNCATGANWSTTGAIPNTGANAVSTQMYIDTSVDNGTIYVAAKTTGGIRGYTMANCAAGAVSFTDPGANNVIGTATVGNAWMNLKRSADGRFHIIANDAQTMVKYYNQTTAAFATGAAGSWNASTAPHVDTTGAAGIAAAGSTRGGLAIDEANDQLLVSWGRTAAVTPTQTWANLVLSYNECPTGTGTCAATVLNSPASSTTMVWGNAPYDTTGQIQKMLLQFPNTAIASTSDSVPAVAYIDYSAGGTAEPVTGARLKYAYRLGSLASDNWAISIIPSTSAPQSPSIAFDHNNQPWVGWFESATSGLRYYLATNTQTNGSGAWIVYPFPAADAAAGTLPVMNQTALAMYYSAGEAKPVLVVLRNPAANKEIRAAMLNPVTGTWSNVGLVMSVAGTTTPGGSNLTADFDEDGNIVVAVHDMGTGAGATCTPTTARCARLAYSTNGGSTWTSGQIYSGAAEGLRVAINKTNNRPAVSFFDRANNLVKYKYCSTALATCTTSTNWADIGLGLVDASAGVSTLTDTGAATNYGLLSIGVSFSEEGYPTVVWPRGSANTTAANLMFSSVLSTATTTFTSPSALYTNAIANIATPVAAVNGNFGLSWNPSSVRTASGSLHTIYNGPGNFMYVTSCGN
ncbi:MAG: hypothetical protein AABZ31_05735 [Bdellovibrionota bacterium]